MRSEYVFIRTYGNLSLDDVNPGPIPSKCDLLEDHLYREIWTALSAL
jgi:hypothetical protein